MNGVGAEMARNRVREADGGGDGLAVDGAEDVVFAKSGSFGSAAREDFCDNGRIGGGVFWLGEVGGRNAEANDGVAGEDVFCGLDGLLDCCACSA